MRIVRQLLVESLLLAVFGGILAMGVAFWGVRVLKLWAAMGQLPMQLGEAIAEGITLDIRVLGATLGFCLIATVLFGLKPALRLSARDLCSDLKESGRACCALREQGDGSYHAACRCSAKWPCLSRSSCARRFWLAPR